MPSLPSDSNHHPNDTGSASLAKLYAAIEQLRQRFFTQQQILEYDQKEIFPEQAIRAMFQPQFGLQRVFIPRAYGGLEGSTHECCEICRTLAGVCLGVSTAFLSVLLGAQPLLVGGTETQKQKWLGAIANGHALAACAVTEADSGSNLSAIQTTAQPQSDQHGNVIGYRINGAKKFISTGGYADFMTVLAKTPQGPAFFVVEKGTQGLVRGQSEQKHGIRASDTTPLIFNNVFTPLDHLVGGAPGQGLKQAAQVFGYTRLMVAAMAVGAGEKAIKIAQDYACKRIMFGTPLVAKQGYTHKLIVPNMARLQAAEAYIHATAARFDAGETDLAVEGSIAKLFASEVADRAADAAMQALGGYGYLAPYEVEKIKRDVRITRIYEGTSEIQQSIIGALRWKQNQTSQGAFYHALSREMEQIEASAPNATGARYYGMAANTINAAFKLVNDHRLTTQQHIMFLLADMITWVEIGCSLARKALKSVQSGDKDAAMISHLSNIFAYETAQLVADNMQTIVRGSGVLDPAAASAFLKDIALDELAASASNVIKAMDAVADGLFV